MLTVRPIDESGNGKQITKVYLCKRGDAEKGFTATEYNEANKNWLGKAISISIWQNQSLVYHAGKDRKMNLETDQQITENRTIWTEKIRSQNIGTAKTGS